MWSWPARLFALSALLLFGGLALGYAAEDDSDALARIGLAGYLSALVVFALGIEAALASIMQRGGEAASRRFLAAFCFAAWLLALVLLWTGWRDEVDLPAGVEWVALAAAVPLPLALWQPALWLTAPRRGRRPPLAPLICLLAVYATLAAGVLLLD
jgi:hypothetical protein